MSNAIRTWAYFGIIADAMDVARHGCLTVSALAAATRALVQADESLRRRILLATEPNETSDDPWLKTQQLIAGNWVRWLGSLATNSTDLRGALSCEAWGSYSVADKWRVADALRIAAERQVIRIARAEFELEPAGASPFDRIDQAVADLTLLGANAPHPALVDQNPSGPLDGSSQAAGLDRPEPIAPAAVTVEKFSPAMSNALRNRAHFEFIVNTLTAAQDPDQGVGYDGPLGAAELAQADALLRIHALNWWSDATPANRAWTEARNGVTVEWARSVGVFASWWFEAIQALNESAWKTVTIELKVKLAERLNIAADVHLKQVLENFEGPFPSPYASMTRADAAAQVVSELVAAGPYAPHPALVDEFTLQAERAQTMAAEAATATFS